MRRDFWERAEARRIQWRADAGIALPDDGGASWTDAEIVASEVAENEATFAEAP